VWDWIDGDWVTYTDPFEVTLGDVQKGVGGRVYFTDVAEAIHLKPQTGPEDVKRLKFKITYTAVGLSEPQTEIAYANWIDELPTTALLGDQTMDMVNEGQLWAVPDPPYPPCDDWLNKTRTQMWTPTSMWLFWTSTRAGTADLFYETISPNFAAMLRKR